MDFADRLHVLGATEGQPALLALATAELAHSELPTEEREAIRRALLAAAVPHWFDPPFLVALLAVNEREAERLHGQLCALKLVEPFPARGERALNVHESARLALREHLRKSDPDWWRTLAERARVHVLASSSVHARIEGLHHLFAIDQLAAAAECEALDRELLQNPEWRQALAVSLSEMAVAGWLQGSALVEALLIPLQVRRDRGETAKLEHEACAVVELAERFQNSPGLARAQCLLGDVYQSQGRPGPALTSFRKSLEIIERLCQEDPSNAGWQRDLGVAHSRLGDVYLSQGRCEVSLASSQKSLAIAERLAEEDPANVNLLHDLGSAHSHHGVVYKRLGHIDAALGYFKKSLAIAEQLVQADPTNALWKRELAVAHSSLGDVFLRQGRLQAAIEYYQKDLAISEHLAQSDPSNAGWQHDLCATHFRIGDVYQRQGRLDSALASFQNSLGILERLAQDNPSNALWKSELAEAKARFSKVNKRRIRQRRSKGFYVPS